MKFNRLAGILAALMLLLCAFGALAEEPAVQPGTPLYIVLTDCGWTLYGEESPSENSVVAHPGDPEGMTLSFAQGVLPKLAEPEAQIMVLGYNDRLRLPEGLAPVNVSDREAIEAQVNSLRGLTGRQSSLPGAALEELAGRIATLDPAYDVSVVILSGGAINYGSADNMNKAVGAEVTPLAEVQRVLDDMRADGVEIRSYVWDLNASGIAKADHPAKDALLLTESVMGEGCTMISGGNINEMIAGLCDAVVTDFGGEEYNAPIASPLKSADLTELKSNDAAVILCEDGSFETYRGGNIVSELENRQQAAAAGDILRLYSAVNVSEQDKLAIQARKLDNMIAKLDADKNGALDAVIEVNAADAVLSAPAAEGYTFAAEPAETFSIAPAADELTLTAKKAGAAKLIIAAADGSVSRELSVTVVDYSIVWNLDDGAMIYAGEETKIAECADPANVMTGMLTENGVETPCEGSDVKVVPVQSGEIAVSVSVAGRETETRSFKVHYHLAEGEDVRNITLKHPYFKAQEGQSVHVMDVNGTAIDLSGFTAAESALAGVYFTENEDELLVVPNAAGEETIVLTDEVSGQTITLNLTVVSLFSQAAFWLLAAAVPVCLIGLTAMIVLLIVKLGGKRR